MVREKGVEDFVNALTTMCLCFSCEMSPWMRQNYPGSARGQQVTAAAARGVLPK